MRDDITHQSGNCSRKSACIALCQMQIWFSFGKEHFTGGNHNSNRFSFDSPIEIQLPRIARGSSRNRFSSCAFSLLWFSELSKILLSVRMSVTSRHVLSRHARALSRHIKKSLKQMILLNKVVRYTSRVTKFRSGRFG